MYQLIFRDVRIAALWVIGIAASVALFFSEGGGQQQLAQTADEIQSKRAAQTAAPAKTTITLPAEPSDAASIPEDDMEGEPAIGSELPDQSYSPGEASAGEAVADE